MTPQTLFRCGAGAAILGGSLRIAASFVPYAPASPLLESLYAVIDVSLLLGLVAIYAGDADALGWPGLVAFATSVAGLASIVGPDATMFGVDWYSIGAGVAALGMAALGAALLSARRHVPSALCWISVPAVALIAPPLVATIGAGVLFGIGFVSAGIAGLTRPAAETS